MRLSIFKISLIILLYSCKSSLDNSDHYNFEYKTGNIPSLNEFLVLNENEKELDSIFKMSAASYRDIGKDSSVKNFFATRDFKYNRARIFLTEVSNGTESAEDAEKDDKKELPAECGCNIYKDTLLITSHVGFFGGMSIAIRVYKKQFKVTYSEYIDDVKPYKQSANSQFTDNISVDSKYQFLLLDKEPNYKSDQQLTGYLTFTSKSFFDNANNNKLDTNYVKGILKFTCKTYIVNESIKELLPTWGFAHTGADEQRLSPFTAPGSSGPGGHLNFNFGLNH